jgi:predicted DNA-binding protein
MSVVKKLISFDSVVAEELESLSKTLDITQKELIERALDFYFDHTDSMTAQKISDDIQEGREKVHDADDVFANLGLE